MELDKEWKMEDKETKEELYRKAEEEEEAAGGV